jgi:hypothetical protein
MTKFFAAILALGLLIGATAPSFAANQYQNYSATAESNTAQ